MESGIRSLLSDNNRYLESFRLFIKTSTEHQCIHQFMETNLPDIISSIGNGESVINVLGVGSGSGEVDLKILSKIQDRYPGVSINNSVVEPSAKQILSYKDLVAQTPGLDNINFCWHQKTSSEFELQVNEEKQDTKYDFIHMIQMIYYVKDISATIQFFRSCLAPNGKLLMILVSGNSGSSIIWKKYGSRLPVSEGMHISADDIAEVLSSMGLKYQYYNLDSVSDITECFIDGDRNGELILDFLTETCDFKNSAPPELRDQIIQDLKSPRCSSLKDGKIIFNSNNSVIVVENE